MTTLQMSGFSAVSFNECRAYTPEMARVSMANTAAAMGVKRARSQVELDSVMRVLFEEMSKTRDRAKTRRSARKRRAAGAPAGQDPASDPEAPPAGTDSAPAAGTSTQES